MISVYFQGKSFNIIEIQVYTPTTHAKEDKVDWFHEDLQNLLEITLKKKKKKERECPFNHWGLKC